MPFTLAHPAAILPLRGLKYLRTAPLVIGAMIPDLPYYLPGRLNILRPETHSVTGSLTTCLALGYAALDAVYLLRRPLTAGDIKPRLLGHWGTSPGLSMIYTLLNRLIRQTGTDCVYVTGPGHARRYCHRAPASCVCGRSRPSEGGRSSGRSRRCRS